MPRVICFFEYGPGAYDYRPGEFFPIDDGTFDENVEDPYKNTLSSGLSREIMKKDDLLIKLKEQIVESLETGYKLHLENRLKYGRIEDNYFNCGFYNEARRRKYKLPDGAQIPVKKVVLTFDVAHSNDWNYCYSGPPDGSDSEYMIIDGEIKCVDGRDIFTDWIPEMTEEELKIYNSEC